MLAHVGPGADVILPLANGEPVGLLDVLERENERLRGVRVHQMHALHERPYIHGAFGDRLRHVSYFLSGATRQAYWEGGCDLVPNHFSEMPRLLELSTRHPIVLAAASPPDRAGYFSLGTNADYVAALIGKVPFFLEVNERMPRTFGLNQIHASQLLGFCEADRPLVEVPPAAPDERDRAIAACDRRADPRRRDAAGRHRRHPERRARRARRPPRPRHPHRAAGRRDRRPRRGGVATGVRKQLRRNKVEATFCLGTQRLYDWLHDNGAVELLPVDLVNDPRRIAREDDFISINATTEVDLYGQCASETIAGRYWSSSGGQADFARGAMYSPRGQAFIVLHSTTGKGRSRIRVRLTEGSVVTTLKNTVDHVVTEYGIAELRGALARRPRAGADRDRPPRPPRGARARGARGRDPARPAAPSGAPDGAPRTRPRP